LLQDVCLLTGVDEQTLPEVETPRFTPAHAIVYDLTEFKSFVERKCVDLSPSGELQIDFEQAQRFLVDSVFADKPRYKLVCRAMKYISSIDEESGAMADSDVQVCLLHI
jgi:hypothetical protein